MAGPTRAAGEAVDQVGVVVLGAYLLAFTKGQAARAGPFIGVTRVAGEGLLQQDRRQLGASSSM